jgi:hypothetical protein
VRPHGLYGGFARETVGSGFRETQLKAVGDDKLKVISVELITQVRKSVTIDWTLRGAFLQDLL